MEAASTKTTLKWRKLVKSFLREEASIQNVLVLVMKLDLTSTVDEMIVIGVKKKNKKLLFFMTHHTSLWKGKSSKAWVLS